jgi:hypothetical protein
MRRKPADTSLKPGADAQPRIESAHSGTDAVKAGASATPGRDQSDKQAKTAI